MGYTLSEMIELQTGYKCFTTFIQDFDIAEKFGADAIRDTYKRAFDEWKGNAKYLTELIMVLNWKIWYWYEQNQEMARLYTEIWEQADEWACNNLKGEDLQYYLRTTD